MRAKASQRNIKMQVSQKTRQAISDMLEKELDYHIQTERVKRELENCVNFTTLLAFRILDIKSYNYVDFEGIRLFLERMGFKAKQKHLNAIFRRLGVNNDAKISFSDLAENMKPLDIYKVPNEQKNLFSEAEFVADPMLGRSPVKTPRRKSFVLSA